MKTPLSLLLSCIIINTISFSAFGMNHTLSLTSSLEAEADHKAQAEMDHAVGLYEQGKLEKAAQKLWAIAKTTNNPEFKAEAFVILADINLRGDTHIKISYAKAKSFVEFAIRLTKKESILAHGYLILGNIYTKDDDKVNRDIKKAIDALTHCVALNGENTKLEALIQLDQLTHEHADMKERDYSQDLQKSAHESLARSLYLCQNGYGSTALRNLTSLSNLERYPVLRARAAIIIGALFYQGDRSVEKNFHEAQRWLQLALSLTKNRLLIAECYLLLGYLHAQGGHGLEKNIEQACKYLTLCTQVNDRLTKPLAFLELGNLAYAYAQTQQHAPNYRAYLEAALINFNKAAQQDHVPEARDKAKAFMKELLATVPD